ncbi:MAG TPA: BlaI/MecI/CopY family transcriptional regulator [Verrucomicrobiae bacterium]|nr:BlaI/MecI/CopY family transcriptional regulator [Verrucomicrobiae bacterium]
MASFTPGELAVMQILWEHGELKPADVQERFPEPIKNPALRSYLKILVDKGHVSRRKVGKAFLYKAATQKQAALRSTLRDMVETYFNGSTKSLVLNLIRREKLSEHDLLELKRLAESDEPKSKGKRT